MVTAHVRDYTVECAAGISEAVLAGRQLAEIPRSLGDNVVVELEDDAPGGLGVDGDVKLRVCIHMRRAARSAQCECTHEDFRPGHRGRRSVCDVSFGEHWGTYIGLDEAEAEVAKRRRKEAMVVGGQGGTSEEVVDFRKVARARKRP